MKTTAYLVLTALTATGCFSPDDRSPASGSDNGAGSTSTGDSTTAESGAETVITTVNETTTTELDTSATTEGASTESGSTTADLDESSSTSTSLATSDTTTEPPAECGNNVVEGGEACDDGINAGAEVGDCAPDCSTEIELREIVLSLSVFDGDIDGAGPGTIIENLDDACPFGYRAIFSDGEDRIATLTPNTGDGQVDWVLRPWTAYVNSDGELLAITDAAALLGLHGGVFSELDNPIVPDDLSGTWTGLNQDWTALEVNENCNNWTSATSDYEMMSGIAGTTDAQFLRQSQDYTYPCSVVLHEVYCAEQ